MSVEDVWTSIRNKEIENLEDVVIPEIQNRIKHYLGVGNATEAKTR